MKLHISIRKWRILTGLGLHKVVRYEGACRGICCLTSEGLLSHGWYAEGTRGATIAAGFSRTVSAGIRRTTSTISERQGFHTPVLRVVRHASTQSCPGAKSVAKADAEITDGRLQSCQVEVHEAGKVVELTQVTGESSRYHAAWLRYNCHCSQCKQEHSGQKLFSASLLHPIYTVQSADVKDENIILKWTEEPDHTGIIPVNHLIENDYSPDSRESDSQAKNIEIYQNGFPEIAYEDVLKTRTGLLRWLTFLNKYGLCLLQGVPTDDRMVKKVAELIWPVQQTIYAEVFDVKSVPEAINIAYTDVELPYHMDLMYYESPPGLQLLHCVRYDSCVEGGESLLVDVFDVVEELRHQYPDHFDTLCNVPATFQKIHYDREKPVHMKYQRPHIVLNPNGIVTAVNWSPAFEGPLFVKEELVEPYYKAYNVFAKMIEKSRTKKERRLQEGELISFNNRRILHARNKFVLNGGVRHLQGTYVNIDHFKNQVEVLSRTVGNGQPARRVGNHDYF